MTQTQDFASRTFVSADGTEVSANGAPVGSAEEQLQRYNDIESLRERVRELQGQLDNPPAPATSGPALPEDARERLIAIPGIGEKLADKVLEVLAEQ